MKLINKDTLNKPYIPIFKREMENIKNKKHSFFIIKFIFIIIFIIYIFIIIYIVKRKKDKKILLSKKSLNLVKIKEDFINDLKNILKNEEIFENEKMDKHTTFKVGGPARIFIKPNNINQIIEIIKLCNKNKINYFILGNGSNLLVSDDGYYGVIIQIHEINFSKLDLRKKNENTYTLIVGGGMLMKTLAIETCLLSLTGLEDIIDIPGTIGGGIIMNASFRGAGLKEPLKKVKVITPEGKILELSKEECKLRHRGSMLKDKKYLVFEATFELKKGDQLIIQKTLTDNTKMRYEKQPMYFGSAGCFFIWNHAKYGSMYEKYKESNLVSYKVGNAMIYTYNIAFIVNLGKGTASQIMEIVKQIEEVMKKNYNIEMRREVIIIGRFNEIEYYF